MPATGRAHGAGGRIAVIDIGSNSIRLVMFERPARALLQVFNEKVMCGLGRGLDETGRLNPDGVALALGNLPRFAAVAAAMGADRIEAFATAAVRDAADGPDFLARVAERCGLEVRLLSGGEEARLSALGVVSGIPEAEGVVGDLGGGSLELVSVRDLAPVDHATLPLGPFRLMRIGNLEAVVETIERQLDRVEWLAAMRGRALYPVGGSWRTFARIHMNHADYPLHVIHHYKLGPAQVGELAGLISRLGRKSLQRLKGASRRRLEVLPYGALVLDCLLRRLRPSEVVFSAYGVREGLVFAGLPEAEKRADPLVQACADPARYGGRFTADGEALFDWMAPLFDGAAEAVPPRLRLAAAWLADVAGLDHPDYRGEHAFFRVLRMPAVGVDHPGRAFLALALLARYEGDLEGRFALPAARLLAPGQLQAARVTGLALRLAIAISAGSTAILRRTRIALSGDRLALVVPAHAPGFGGDVIRRRLDALAATLARPGEIVDHADP